MRFTCTFLPDTRVIAGKTFQKSLFKAVFQVSVSNGLNHTFEEAVNQVQGVLNPCAELSVKVYPKFDQFEIHFHDQCLLTIYGE